MIPPSTKTHTLQRVDVWEPQKTCARVLVLKVVGLGEEISKRGTAGSVRVFVCVRYNLGLSSLDRGKSRILSK